MNRAQLSQVSGPVACMSGLLVLSATIPFVPQRFGLPAHRIVEMTLFWIGLSLVLLGSGRSFTAATTREHETVVKAARILATLGTLLAVTISLISLTNLLFTSLWGARLVLADRGPVYLYPKVIGYALAIPLLFALALQAPLGLILATTIPQPKPLRIVGIAHLAVVIALLGLFLVFVGTCGLAVVDRRFAVASVATTWLAGLMTLVVTGGRFARTLAQFLRSG